MTRRRAAFVLGTVAGILASPVDARASEADDLFREGVRLLDHGDLAAACGKLQRSYDLEPSAGTLLNLAACHEKSGHGQRALRLFQRAAVAARARGREEWVKLAEEHARDIARSLPSVTIVRRGERDPAEQTEITLDGEIVAAAELGAPISIDPGRHVIDAHARGFRAFSVTFDAPGTSTVTVPALASDARPPPPAPAHSPPSRDERGSRDNTRRTVGFGLGIGGSAGLVLGIVGLGAAGSALSDARAACPSYPDRCGPEAQGPNDRAQTWSTISTVSLTAGIALVAAGAILVFWPSGAKSVSATMLPASAAFGGRP